MERQEQEKFYAFKKWDIQPYYMWDIVIKAEEAGEGMYKRDQSYLPYKPLKVVSIEEGEKIVEQFNNIKWNADKQIRELQQKAKQDFEKVLGI